MSERQIAFTKIKGVWTLPVGLRLLSYEVGHQEKTVRVSTVRLDGAHLEDPLHICDPESGYETAVFFENCSLFSIYQRHYDNEADARAGHDEAVKGILAGTLPLAITLGWYNAWDAEAATP